MSPMRPRHRVSLSLLAVACLAFPAGAQILETPAIGLGMALDPLARTARPVGMGRLTVVLPDVNNRLTMWDYAGNPTGILDADSMSTIEIRPGGWSGTSARDAEDAGGTFERQDFAGNHKRVAIEGWRRAGGTVFGGFGEISTLRTDRPHDPDSEQRSTLSRPNMTFVLNGKMPYVATERMRYALRAFIISETAEDEYRMIQRNAAGEYLTQDGQLVGPPNRFDPDEARTRSSGGGLAFSYRFATWLTLAAGGDFRMDKVRSQNQGDRYLSEYEEDRPYGIGQVSLVGRYQGLEYGADARNWDASSDAIYVFTGSAGIGAIPLTGRGNYYTRHENGSVIRGRARWTSGAFEVGGSVRNGSGRVEITPPPVSDRSSLNAYLYNLYVEPRADSIALRDSVRHEIRERQLTEFAGGVAYHLPGRQGAAIGIETHVWTDQLEQLESGEGPNGAGWDVRAGIDWPLTDVLAGRAGFIYRSEDLDELTEANEYVSNALTIGAGFQPAMSRWRFESGFVFEWGQGDFGSPARPRFTRQQVATQLRWAF